jgi:hypothetical protein
MFGKININRYFTWKKFINLNYKIKIKCDIVFQTIFLTNIIVIILWFGKHNISLMCNHWDEMNSLKVIEIHLKGWSLLTDIFSHTPVKILKYLILVSYYVGDSYYLGLIAVLFLLFLLIHYIGPPILKSLSLGPSTGFLYLKIMI